MTDGPKIFHFPYSGEKGWIGVDLDRTLAEYHGKVDGVYDPMRIGKPIKKMVDRIRWWLYEGYEVRIFTARMSGFNLEEGSGIIARAMVADNIQNWLEREAGLPRLEVTNVKDMDCCQIWDDIAVGMEPNTGEIRYANQIAKLADFIMQEVPGEPSESEGAIDTAIRWMRERLS